MNQHNRLFHAINKMARPPLDILEAEARAKWPGGAERGSLYVLKRGSGFSYQWGDAEISRRDAVKKLGEMGQ